MKEIIQEGFIQKSKFDSDNYATINVGLNGREGFHGDGKLETVTL